jgi:hypothetical protein
LFKRFFSCFIYFIFCYIFYIDQEIYQRLFTKFASKSSQGSGLGLYISKNIIKAHGGIIWAENNKDGKGSTFAFYLPSIDNHYHQEGVVLNNSISNTSTATNTMINDIEQRIEKS